MGRIRISGTELLCNLKMKCDKLPPSISGAETAGINTVPHLCIFVLVICELQYFFEDLMITRMPSDFQQHCCISGFHFLTRLGLKFMVS